MSTTRRRLLIAEDHANVATSLAALLQPDYEVLALVGDGSRVQDAVAQHRPELLLLDLWLPGRNGLDLLTDLHREFPEVRLVVLTMHSDIVVAVEAMNRGALGFILKDSGYEELQHALKQVFEGRPYLSPRVSGESARSSGIPDSSDPRTGASRWPTLRRTKEDAPWAAGCWTTCPGTCWTASMRDARSSGRTSPTSM